MVFNAFASKGVLGSIEFKADSIKAIPKWVNVLAKIKREETIFKTCELDSDRCEDKDYLKWVKFIQETKKFKMPLKDKLNLVNDFANKWPYKTDIEIWQVSDYWASPAEFVKHSGDCEDYAIIKFISLKKLGVDPKILRIVVLQDTIRNIAHAVLSVDIKNNFYILDSLISMVIKDSRLKHYIPQYSVNDTSRWAHIMPTAVKPLKNNKPIINDKINIDKLLFDSYGE